MTSHSLHSLDSVPWAKLLHAYGSASDVPEQLRALASHDKAVREQALWSLFGNIFHQGTRYQATPYAVPFLYELLRQPHTPDKHEIVGLLVHVAVGYAEDYLPAGLDPVALRRELTSLEQQMSATERAACAEYGSGPLVDLACYDAVRQGVPTLLELLEHRDAQVRGAAVYALAWFAEDASAALPRLHALLASEQDSAVLANAMLSIGLLARLASHPEAAAPLQRYLDHDSLLLRVAAAIGAARAPLAEPIIAALVEAARDSERLAQVGENVLFHEGDLTGYASLMLARFGANDRARIVPVLCQALRGVAAYRSLAVTRALLELVIPRDSATPIREVPADQLDPLLRQALTAIAEYGGWGVNGATFVNYATLVRSYGLPDSQAALRRYLA